MGGVVYLDLLGVAALGIQEVGWVSLPAPWHQQEEKEKGDVARLSSSPSAFPSPGHWFGGLLACVECGLLQADDVMKPVG